jgi:hypothetical protein
MKLAPENTDRFPDKIQMQASARIILLALISFLLGVVATTFWFRHNAENPGLPVSPQPSAAQPAPAATTVNTQTTTHPSVANQPPINPEAVAEVKRAIPNYASLSVEDGTKILRQAAMKQFTAAAKETDLQVRQAQEQLSQAENGQSADQQQAAMKHLQQTQAAGSAKLQQISMQLQAQIAALKSLKHAE